MTENILLKIIDNFDNFSFTEKKIGKYILNHQDEIPKMSIKDLGNASGTSQATIVRFSRSVGATGFSDLKIQLSALQNLDKSLLEEINPEEDLESIEGKLTLRIQQTLAETNKTLDETIISKVVDLIIESKSISIFGIGASLLAARDFVLKFGRLGISPFLARDADEVIAHLSNQPTPGVFIVISNSGERPLLKNILKSVPPGNKTVVLTRTPKSQLAKCADYVLTYSSSGFHNPMRTSATTSLLAQLYCIDLLYYRYFQRDFERHAHQIQKSYSRIHGKPHQKKIVIDSGIVDC
ncbi:MurR/RpiR family transcriptional regulator [Xylocopilactobacillus apicola]|uniref:RpiR family transcriptional regulator n=1 Tax=Xylocopilactobacillus apicola TaxID=2932184 RepID=A0AAU9DQN6_9LACO|nr:MurR/RpiR family transcriptional regulator [Xylocopilactobacillus apicola]BDR58204.1 RpiR family transcriptional regulator [Xylocopilactobacillus apicola]